MRFHIFPFCHRQWTTHQHLLWNGKDDILYKDFYFNQHCKNSYGWATSNCTVVLWAHATWYMSGSEINFFRQAPTGDWPFFFNCQMGECGDQLWNSGRQCKIFSCIGDQESAISDPVGVIFKFSDGHSSFSCESPAPLWELFTNSGWLLRFEVHSFIAGQKKATDFGVFF